jgi:hypothetical protein
MLNKLINWALNLFKKPEQENAFNKALVEVWPFPPETPKKKPQVKKATTRAKKPAVVAKKAIKAKAKAK